MLNSLYCTFILNILLLTKFAIGTTIREAFDVATGDRPASCDAYNNQLNQFWDESKALAQNALDVIAEAMSENPPNDKAAQLLSTFFGVRGGEVAAREDIIEWYAGVQGFLNGKPLHNAGNPGGGRPLLFCDDTWLVKQTWHTQAVNTTGQPVLNPANQSPLSIYNAAVSVNNGWLSHFVLGRLPYFSRDLNEYVFDKDSTGSYCSEGNLAGTQDQTTRSTTSLCPRSFRPSTQTGTATLGSRSPGRREFIQRSSSLSLTLFHELFHLVHQNAYTPDHANGGARVCLLLVEKGEPHEPFENPETYAYFALSAYYYKSKGIYFRAGKASR